MTKREAAIVSAYTGYLVGKFSDMQLYVDTLVGHSTWTHQYADKTFEQKVMELAKPDFIAITVVDESEAR